jgi:hypothetical protein
MAPLQRSRRKKYFKILYTVASSKQAQKKMPIWGILKKERVKNKKYR